MKGGGVSESIYKVINATTRSGILKELKHINSEWNHRFFLSLVCV